MHNTRCSAVTAALIDRHVSISRANASTRRYDSSGPHACARRHSSSDDGGADSASLTDIGARGNKYKNTLPSNGVDGSARPNDAAG